MAIEATTSGLFVRIAKMGDRLRGRATALQGIGVTGGVFGFVVAFVVAIHTRRNAAGVAVHPYVGIGVALAMATCLLIAFTVVLAQIVEVLAEYVSTAHLVEVSER
jgi:hypothetical protein